MRIKHLNAGGEGSSMFHLQVASGAGARASAGARAVSTTAPAERRRTEIRNTAGKCEEPNRRAMWYISLVCAYISSNNNMINVDLNCAFNSVRTGFMCYATTAYHFQPLPMRDYAAAPNQCSPSERARIHNARLDSWCAGGGGMMPLKFLPVFLDSKPRRLGSFAHTELTLAVR
jgi:hypothetical protein